MYQENNTKKTIKILYESTKIFAQNKELRPRLYRFSTTHILKREKCFVDVLKIQAYHHKKHYHLGTRRVNEPMHAVLEGELGESEMVEGNEAQNIRNRALLHYLSFLANSNSTKDTFDFDFVESLLKNGADVNSTDKTGQTVFHEVARSWNSDVASFLIKYGKNDTTIYSSINGI